jgi:5'(3')-deoxyribonucleotidase
MIVYLDVDGVLANFNKGVCDAFGFPYDYKQINKWHWFNDINQTNKSVSKKCTINFWSNLHWMHDGQKILEIIRDKFWDENIFLLTTPMPNVKSATGKWQWIKNNLPDFYYQTIICAAPKILLANSNALLIDDCTKNVDEFRQAGGQTILVPRPWNSLHLLADKSVEIVKQQLAEIKCQKL